MYGYEYERKVLFPIWEREHLESKNASIYKETRERFKEIGLELLKDPLETEDRIRNHIIKNPDNFYPKLSPDYEFIKSTRISKCYKLM